MTAVFIQVLTLFIFVAVGFVLGNRKLIDPGHAGILSTVLVYVALPCNVFRTLRVNFTPEQLSANKDMLTASVLLILLAIVLGHITARRLSKDSYESYLYEYSFIIPNYGYMGYALTEALLGTAGLANLIVFGLPASVYIYTVGFARLTKSGMNLKKLINPSNIATVLGITAGLLTLPIPAMFDDILSKAAACMGPISMLLTGVVVAELPIRKVIGNIKIYILIALRMVLFPILLFFALRTFCAPEITRTAVLYYALPFGLNTVVFPKLIGEDCKTGTGMALISTTAACLTLPLVLSFVGIGV